MVKDDQLLKRTKEFALRVIRMAESLGNSQTERIIKNQIIRSAASVGANYRAAKRAKSIADFINKMGTVEEETDESMYWMEIIIEAGFMKEAKLVELYKESNEILSMVIASIKTAKKKTKKAERNTGNK